MAESLLTGLVYILFIMLVDRNFVSGICKLKPKETLITYFFVKKTSFFQPWVPFDMLCMVSYTDREFVTSVFKIRKNSRILLNF